MKISVSTSIVIVSVVAMLFATSPVNAGPRDRSNERERQVQVVRPALVTQTRVVGRSVVHPRNTVVVVPRHRRVNNVVIVRTYGHAYHGYGHFHHDNDAWKWLAFTAITLKILDNIDEESQRAHEAAQVKATTAPVGEPIVWETSTSSGSVVTTKQGLNDAGQTCREFQQTVTIGGETEQAHGTACLQNDGSWKMI